MRRVRSFREGHLEFGGGKPTTALVMALMPVARLGAGSG
jgi:hypothetical protein